MSSHEQKFVEGFSKWPKEKKIDWLAGQYLAGFPEGRQILERYWHPDKQVQALHDGFIENTLGNYWLPFAVAPNFLINGRLYAVPMVIEESSVVAAAAKGAKFWYPFGGFQARVKSTVKYGHIHLLYYNDPAKLRAFFETTKDEFLNRLKPFTANMEKRGGGILSVELEDLTSQLPHYFTVTFRVDTADSMGANFINTILEEWADYMEEAYSAHGSPGDLEIVMRILSNLNPECTVSVRASAPVEELEKITGQKNYAHRLVQAFEMARVNPFRAVTHNKGIMNGMDAVVVATGNDFRAVEAGAHSWAAYQRPYTALSQASVRDGQLVLQMEVPLTLGTVGGMTRLHPMARLAMEMLGRPGARELMQIVASVGLAQNFSAVHSLVTEGIQKGHMKMHLNNILAQLGATEEEKQILRTYFHNRKAHVHLVKQALQDLRNKKLSL